MEVVSTLWRDRSVEMPLHMDGNGGGDHPLDS